jgi:hypothetical protein
MQPRQRGRPHTPSDLVNALRRLIKSLLAFADTTPGHLQASPELHRKVYVISP